MSVLYVVRHGQASFFEDDYDQLSPLGIQQSQLLGQYWIDQSIEIDEVYSGSLSRQRQTAESTGESFAKAGGNWPELKVVSGLNEYSSEGIMNVLRPELTEKHADVRRLSEEFDTATDPRQRYRTFHRLLEALMKYYIAGEYEAEGFETWQEFHGRVTAAFSQILSKPERGRRVAVFTSGGPVGIAIQTALQAPQQQAAELHWRVCNASVTTFQFSQGRITLDQFNAIPHLTSEPLRTYR
jgi:broad specificity phosphatase PhoE